MTMSEDEIKVVRAVFAAMIKRYGVDGTLTIFENELDDELPEFILEDIAGGFRVHILPDFVKVGEESKVNVGSDKIQFKPSTTYYLEGTKSPFSNAVPVEFTTYTAGPLTDIRG